MAGQALKKRQTLSTNVPLPLHTSKVLPVGTHGGRLPADRLAASSG